MSVTDPISAATAAMRELEARRGPLADEVAELGCRANLTPGEDQRLARQTVALEHLEAEIREARLAWQDAVNAGLANGTVRSKPGSPGSKNSGPTFMRGVDPWALDDEPLPNRADPEATRARAITAIERTTAMLPDHARQTATIAVETCQEPDDLLARWAIESSSPHYESAYFKLLRDNQRGHLQWTGEEQRAYQRASTVSRALNVGADATGLAMVPISLDPAIMLSGAGAPPGILTKMRIVTGASRDYEFVSSAGVTASFSAEAVEVADNSPTLAQPTIRSHRYTAFVPVSFEWMGDAREGVSEVNRILMDAYTTLLATKVLSGAGDASNEPYGLVTRLMATTSQELLTTTTSLTVADLYSAQAALGWRHRQNASWVAPLVAIHKCRRFGEGTTGSNSAYWSDLGGGTPPLLLGSPVLEGDAGFDLTPTTTGDPILAYVDLARYIHFARVGATVEVVQHLFSTTTNRPSGERGLLLWGRSGGDLVVPEAGVLLENK